MVEIAPDGAGALQQGFAGDVLNALWYVRQTAPSDWSLSFFSGFGEDAVSRQMREFIEAANISCAQSAEVRGRTVGLYMIHLEQGERSFSYWRDSSAAREMLQDPDALASRISAADVILVSGITLAILSAPDQSLFLDVIKENKRKTAILAFDPNIRPRLWETPELCHQTISRAGEIADIVLPSFDDEQATFGDPTPQDTAQRYLDLGAGLVVVKNGTHPTLTATMSGRELHSVAPVQNVVDTTAAGDSFNGAFLASYCSGASLAEAIRAGQECSAAVVGTRGALVSL